METNIRIYKQLLNTKHFKLVDNKLISYDFYIIEKNKNLKEQITLEDFLYEINNSSKLDILTNSLDNIFEEYIYPSDTHGINHNYRVSLYGFYIALKEQLNDNDIKLILEACKYHDIGRIDDYEDKTHGFRSAKILEKFENLTEEELNILKCMVTYHSVDDKYFNTITNMFKIKDLKRVKKLCDILKDADALDRTRADNKWGLNCKYLRTAFSKKLIYLSYELLYNYNEIKKRYK